MIELHEVYKSLGGKPILTNLSCRFRPGEFVGITGPIGAGKSTLLHVVSGLITPDRGSVNVFGVSFQTHEQFIKQKINYASSNQLLSGYATVSENLSTFSLLYGLTDTKKTINSLFSIFGLHKTLLKTKVYRLSSGENAVVNLIKALLNNPDILLLDEICAHTDPTTSQRIHGYLAQRNSSNRLTLYASQNTKELARVCTKVITIKQGKIIKNISIKHL